MGSGIGVVFVVLRRRNLDGKPGRGNQGFSLSERHESCSWSLLRKVAPRPQNLEPSTRPGGGLFRRNRNRASGSQQTRVPGYPGTRVTIHYLTTLLAFGRRRVWRTRVSGYRNSHTLFAPLFRLSGGVVGRTRVPGYPGYHTLLSPLGALGRRRGRAKGGNARLHFAALDESCQRKKAEGKSVEVFSVGPSREVGSGDLK